jgi:hypothetical protein
MSALEGGGEMTASPDRVTADAGAGGKAVITATWVLVGF